MPTVVLKLGDDVSTDVIYPGRYMATVLPTETPQHAFADLAEWSGRLKAGQVPAGGVLVAGRNFGCGSSREQAASCLKGHELTIVASGFARIFLQNAINLGLAVVTAPGIDAAEGDQLEIGGAEVLNTTSGRRFAVQPLPSARQSIIDAGGLVAYTRTRLEAASRRPSGQIRRSMEDILRTAIEREADSYDYYHDAAMEADEAELRDFLLGLAEMEQEHSRRLREELEKLQDLHWVQSQVTC